MKKLLVLFLSAALLLTGCTVLLPNPGATAPTAARTEPGAAGSTERVTETVSDPAQTEPPLSTAAPVSTEAEMTTEAPTTTEEPAPVSKNPWEYLGSLSYDAGTYLYESVEYSYSFDLPCIVDDRPGAAEINEAIDRQVAAHVRKSKEAIDNHTDTELLEVGFHASVWADVLSVIIVERYSYNMWTEYYVYNYETTTGLWLSNEMLLDKMGVSEQVFMELADVQIRRSFIEENGENPNEMIRQEYDFAMDRIEQYVNMDLQFYPIEGDIVICAPIPNCIGAEYHMEELELGLNLN